MTRDAVSDYLERIGSTPVLTAAEERALCRAIEAGVLAGERLGLERAAPDAADLETVRVNGHRAFETMVASNLKLVVSVARRYLSREVPFADLIQDGNLGLIRAVQGFDHNRGYRFSTYAHFWISESIDQGITRQAHIIKLPHYQLARLAKARRERHDLTADLGREPTLDELAAHTATEREKLKALMRIDLPIVSIHQQIGVAEAELGDHLVDIAAVEMLDKTIGDDELAALGRAVQSLDPTERQVVSWTFGLGGRTELGIRDIARRLEVSAPVASDILTASIEKLRSCEQLAAAAS